MFDEGGRCLGMLYNLWNVAASNNIVDTQSATQRLTHTANMHRKVLLLFFNFHSISTTIARKAMPFNYPLPLIIGQNFLNDEVRFTV